MALAGITVVTVNPAYRQDELRYIVSQSRADGIFLLEEYRGYSMAGALDSARPHLPELRHVWLFSKWERFIAGGVADATLPEVTPDDVAQIQYTSTRPARPGSCREPTPPPRNHQQPPLLRDAHGLSAGRRLATSVPCFHTGGSVLLALGPVASLATNVLMRGFEPGLALELHKSPLCNQPSPSTASAVAAGISK